MPVCFQPTAKAPTAPKLPSMQAGGAVQEQLAEGDRQAEKVMAAQVGGRAAAAWVCGLGLVMWKGGHVKLAAGMPAASHATCPAMSPTPPPCPPPTHFPWQESCDPDYNPDNPAEEAIEAERAGGSFSRSLASLLRVCLGLFQVEPAPELGIPRHVLAMLNSGLQ